MTPFRWDVQPKAQTEVQTEGGQGLKAEAILGNLGTELVPGPPFLEVRGRSHEDVSFPQAMQEGNGQFL